MKAVLALVMLAVSLGGSVAHSRWHHFKSQLRELSGKVDTLTSQMTAINERLGQRTIQVGFHATFHGEKTLTRGARVTFNSIAYNQGNGFENNVFTAPVSGMYLLYLQIEPDPKHKSGMMVNVTERNQVLYVFANDPDTYEMASAQRVIHLSKGHKAWVVTTEGDSNRHRWNTNFGGFLVQADA